MSDFPRSLFAVACWLTLAGAAGADDWPQWTGPQRDSVWRESGILKQFPESGPRVLWRQEVSGGYAGPAVAAGRVFVTDYVRSAGAAVNDPNGRTQLQGVERILCLDAQTGDVLWKHEYECPYSISYPAGPRATPTVDGDRVYALGAEGNLVCLKVASGDVLWQVDFKQAYRAPTPLWGFCSHPLVDDKHLYTLVGGEGSAVVAFNKHTGQEVWRALSAPDAGYAPATMVTVGDVQQLVVWHPLAAVGLNPQTGDTYWTVPLEPDYGMSINPARQMGDYLFIGGIVNRAVMLKLSSTRPEVEVVWRAGTQRGIGPVHSPPVLVDDTLYGVNRLGELTAVDVATGDRLWETWAATTGERPANSGTAFLVRHGDRFFIFNEAGQLILANLTRSGYEERGRMSILAPTNEAFGRPVVWSHPAFANRAIYARNDREIVCVSLAAD